MHLTRAFRRVGVAAVCVVGIVGIAGSAYIAGAASPGSDGVIRACAKTNNGDLRVVDGDTCKKHETPVQWNQQGVPGAPGPQGAPGPAGQPGPKGDPGGVSGYQIVSVSSDDSSSSTRFVTAECPPGKVAVGGAAAIDKVNGSVFTLPDVSLMFSDVFNVTGRAWTAGAHETQPTDDVWRLIVRAICVNA